MEIHLSRKTGLTGTEYASAWTVSVINKEGDVVIQASAVTAQGALREVKRQLEEAVNSISEMMKGTGG